MQQRYNMFCPTGARGVYIPSTLCTPCTEGSGRSEGHLEGHPEDYPEGHLEGNRKGLDSKETHCWYNV